MIYCELPEYTAYDIRRIICTEDIDEIKIVPLSVGEYCENLDYAEDVCIYVYVNYADEEVRANAILGLSYLARRFNFLSSKVIPYLQMEYNRSTKYRERIIFAIEDIELFTKGSICRTGDGSLCYDKKF